MLLLHVDISTAAVNSRIFRSVMVLMLDTENNLAKVSAFFTFMLLSY